MTSKQHSIELNGKQYDARTGQLLPARHQHAKKVTGKTIDGVMKKSSHLKSQAQATAHAVHQRAERSKTLMRHAVKKPSQPAKAHKTQRTAPKSHQHVQADVDPKRAARAQRVHQSTLISRFGAPKATTPATPALMPVQPEPETPSTPLLKQHHELFKGQPGNHAFQKAIEHATSHTQPRPHRMTKRQRVARKFRLSPRTVNIAAGSLAALLLIGFVAYQNAPNLTMQLASARSGIDGRLPGYQPAGFGMNGPIKYRQGQITLRYKAHTDDRQFSINQRSSDWNSQALLENFINQDNHTYQTYQNSGKTIYIYDANNATWVDGGVWYQIEGQSSLSSEQLLRLAASM